MLELADDADAPARQVSVGTELFVRESTVDTADPAAAHPNAGEDATVSGKDAE
jgi:hypothetical protein